MGIESFSEGYYHAEMKLQPYDAGPVIEVGLYDYIEAELYPQTNAPPTMQIGLSGGPYFTPAPEPGVPPGVLAVPKAWIDDLMLDEPARPQNIFLLKPEHSFFFQQASIADPTFDN